MKIVYSDPKSGRTAQAELGKDKAGLVLNYKIGDTIDGGIIGLTGCKLKITGGSDNSGFPLERSIQGTIKTRTSRITATGRSAGKPKMQTVRGNMVSTDVEQLNTVITEYGEKGVDEIFPKAAKQGKAAEPAKDAEKPEAQAAEAKG